MTVIYRVLYFFVEGSLTEKMKKLNESKSENKRYGDNWAINFYFILNSESFNLARKLSTCLILSLVLTRFVSEEISNTSSKLIFSWSFFKSFFVR